MGRLASSPLGACRLSLGQSVTLTFLASSRPCAAGTVLLKTIKTKGGRWGWWWAKRSPLSFVLGGSVGDGESR